MTLAPWFLGAIDPDLEALLRYEVDDLAKFNVLFLLRRERGLRADAGSLARALGFHSIEQTERKLHELAQCGLLTAESTLGGPTRYRLAEDEGARRRLAKLWKLAHREAYFSSLLHHLAERSIEAAQAHTHHPRRSR